MIASRFLIPNRRRIIRRIRFVYRDRMRFRNFSRYLAQSMVGIAVCQWEALGKHETQPATTIWRAFMTSTGNMWHCLTDVHKSLFRCIRYTCSVPRRNSRRLGIADRCPIQYDFPPFARRSFDDWQRSRFQPSIHSSRYHLQWYCVMYKKCEIKFIFLNGMIRKRNMEFLYMWFLEKF